MTDKNINGADMDGETLRGDSDTFSMLTTTTARLAMPMLLNEVYDAPQPVSEPFPPFLLHCTLFAFYEGYPPHSAAFCNIGLPARYARGESSASQYRVARTVSKYNRRLGVQLPLHYLSTDPVTADVKALFFHPHPRNGAEMMARQPSLKRGRMFTLFATMTPELTGIVSRPLVDRALSALFFGTGIDDKMTVFPGEAVLTYGAKYRKADKGADGSSGRGALGWLRSLMSSHSSSGAGGSRSGADKAEEKIDAAPASAENLTPSHIKIRMVYATLDLLPPPPRLAETKGLYPKEMNKSSSAEQDQALKIQMAAAKMSPDERYQIFGWEMDEQGRTAIMEMLRALERRGGIWAEAGRVTMPSSRNPDSKERARYMVKGLFPEHFINRCSWFRSKDHQPMPSDLSVESVAKYGSPVVVHLANERLGAGQDIAQQQQPPSNPVGGGGGSSSKEDALEAE